MDLNIKAIGSDIYTSVYDKRDDFGLPFVNFLSLSGYVPRLASYGITFRSCLDLVGVVLAIWNFHFKNLKSLQNC